MNEEYTYDIGKYTIGIDNNGEDGIGLTVAIINDDGEIHFLGNCYGDNARCIDLLIKENQQLKEQQKEFIDYLDAIISHLENDIKYYENNYTPTGKYLKATRTNQYNCLLQTKAKYEEILSKLVEIDQIEKR